MELIRQVYYYQLAGLLGTDSGYEAWDRLSALIQTGPPISPQAALPEIGDEDDLSVTEQRKEVLRALYEAATSGNVTAVLKWLDFTVASSISRSRSFPQAKGRMNRKWSRRCGRIAR